MKKLNTKLDNKYVRTIINRANGITLISLVITIIILIVLAGIAIRLSLGENNLLNRVKETKRKYEIAQAKEYIELKINECTIEKNGNATLQDIVDYLSEDSNVTYYVALEEIALVAGEISVGEPKEIYVVYNSYQFKIEENREVEFISIVDVDIEGKITIESEVQEYLGKNEEGTYTASILLKATGEAKIEKLEIQNPDGTELILEPNGLTMVGKDMTIEYDKEYVATLTTLNGHKYTKKIIERTEEIIMTAEELANFRDKVNSGLTYEGKTINLGADIDLSTVCGENVNGKEISWEPIGDYSTNNTLFKGIFDGNNYEISNIYINESKNYQGLFGYIKEAKINNTIIEGKIKAQSCVGGVCGFSQNSKIERCVNKVQIIATGESNKAQGRVGGIVGYPYTGCEITNCVNYADITGVGCVGGISGYSHYTNLDNCYNCGNITGTGAFMNSEANVGGITGVLNTSETIKNCYNTGNINAAYQVIGGIVGYFSYGGNATMNYCINTGTVSKGSVTATSLYNGSSYTSLLIGRRYGNKGTVTNNESITSEVLKEYTEEQIKAQLGDGYTKDIQNEDGTWKYNDGYPILKWQLEENKD